MAYLAMRFCAHARLWQADVAAHPDFFLSALRNPRLDAQPADVVDRTVLAAQSLWMRASPPRDLPPAAYKRQLLWCVCAFDTP